MAVAELAKPRLGIQDILALTEKRLKLYEARNAWYDLLMSFYLGRQPQGTMYSPTILAMNSQGRPLLRQVGESINANRAYSSQRLAPIVDDYAALYGRMPTTRVEAPDPSEQGTKKAELLTKYLYSTYELSNLETQQAEAGFYQSGFGDACWMLDPEPDAEDGPRVVWTQVNPRNVLPRFWKGYRRFEVFDAIVVEVWDPDDIRTTFGFTPYGEDPKHCTVMIYVSPHQRSVVVGTDYRAAMVRDVAWDLGFCPCCWIFNKTTGHMGMSDIGQSLEQQKFLDWAFNVWADGLVNMTYPILMIKNPTSMGADAINIGPGAPPVPVGPDGDLKAIATNADPQALSLIMQQTLNDINTATGTSQVRQEGQMPGSIITGRATHAVQGPQSTRVEYKQGVMANSWRLLNRMTLLMQERAPALRDFKGNIYGRYQGRSFQEEFDASRDIDGWTRNTVTWEALVGLNQQQKLGIAYEGMVSEIWDDIRAREIMGEDDPIGMRERVKNMLLAKAEMQKLAGGGEEPQGQPSSPGQGGPPNQGARPSPGAGGAPPLQFRPPNLRSGQPLPMGQPPHAPPSLPGGQPQGGTLDKVKAALGKIADKLRGAVYAVGDLAKDGQAGQIALVVSDARDKNVVLQAARLLDPQAVVRAVPEDRIPDTAVRVA